MANPSDNWPLHPDGRKKQFGELTSGERTDVMAESIRRLQADFDDPVYQEKILHVLSGGRSQ